MSRQFQGVFQRAAFFGLMMAIVVSAAIAQAQQDGKSPGLTLPDGKVIPLLDGPAVGLLGTQAEVKVPKGYQFMDANGTRLYMEALGNPTNGTEWGTIIPENGDWFVVFEFDQSGYVKDDEGHSLDADAILNSIRQGTEHANAERKKRGHPTMQIVGWEQKPNYNQQTHNLEWAIRGASEGKPIINYNTRLLGRSGVMAVTLVADPETLKAVVPEYRNLLAAFSYRSGNKYSEFRAGDKVAEYGLTALVAGGAAAVAAKTGLLAKLAAGLAKAWKAIIVGVLVLAGAIKAMFAKLFGGGSRSSQ